MQFLNIVMASMLATLAASTQATEASPVIAASSASTELIDLWQDA
jgi:hypothetical protein